MEIPHAMVIQLQTEGITTIGDLADFEKDSLQQLADNLCCPGGRIPDPSPNAATGATIPTPAFTFGVKSQKRLLVACNLIQYYNTMGQDLMAANMQWTHVMKNFEIQGTALKDRKKDDDPEVPKITKALPIIKWMEAFQEFLHQIIGVRVIPLVYVIHTTVNIPAPPSQLTVNQPHSNEHGSVEAELIDHSSHTHALYCDDDLSVYFHLKEAAQETTYAASIKPFQWHKDGRGTWMALMNQYAGDNEWEVDIKKQDDLLHMHIWKGQSSFLLEGFIAQHRNAYVSMQQCAEHVEYQLPNQHTHTGYLLEGIQCPDPGLQVATASICTNNGMQGMHNNFEATATHLLPYAL